MTKHLVLYGERLWDSPYVLSVFATLVEKGVEFETRALDLAAGEQREAAFAARSLGAKVPTLDHDGFWLSESAAIVEYLDEAFPAPTHAPALPRGLHERARARQLMALVRTDFLALRRERPTSTIFFPERATAPLGDEARANADKLVRVATALLPPGATQLFPAWSTADTDLAIMLMRLVANGDELPAPLRHYVETQWQRPGVQAFVAQPRSSFTSLGNETT